MSTLRALASEASRLGVSIQLAHLDGDLCGLYDHEHGIITVDLSLTMPQKKEAIAHELGHCFYGDECSTGSRERRADRYAARLLIDPLAYRAAEILDPEPGAIAAELGQTKRMVRVYQKEWLPSVSLTRRFRAG